MADHKITTKKNTTITGVSVVRMNCICGWCSPWYNERFEFVGKCLKDDMLDHLHNVGIIKDGVIE